jgi:hypothetical protein
MMGMISPFIVTADDEDEEEIEITKSNGNENGEGPRGLDVPIVSAYNGTTHLVSVLFLSNLGIVDVDIENEDAGVSSSYQVNSAIGYHSFVISGATGLWTITFTLSDGTEYIGEWTIN